MRRRSARSGSPRLIWVVDGSGTPTILAVRSSNREEALMSKVDAVPPGYHTITPSLAIRNAERAIEFYKKAFGAEEQFRMPGPDGKLMHAELRIGNSIIMLGEEMPEWGARSPSMLGGSPVSFYLYVDDVDAFWNRAVAAGAKPTMPLSDMFWGDRMGKLEDPFGHVWAPAQHVKDMTPEELKQAQDAFFAQMQTA
jgi:PhnB protein